MQDVGHKDAHFIQRWGESWWGRRKAGRVPSQDESPPREIVSESELHAGTIGSSHVIVYTCFPLPVGFSIVTDLKNYHLVWWIIRKKRPHSVLLKKTFENWQGIPVLRSFHETFFFYVFRVIIIISLRVENNMKIFIITPISGKSIRILQAVKYSIN